jgi:hypothetical protein
MKERQFLPGPADPLPIAADNQRILAEVDHQLGSARVVLVLDQLAAARPPG